MEGLETNENIFGFHFAGNYGFVDIMGKLKIPKDFIKE